MPTVQSKVQGQARFDMALTNLFDYQHQLLFLVKIHYPKTKVEIKLQDEFVTVTIGYDRKHIFSIL